MSIRYNRVLEPEIEKALLPDGIFRFLISDIPLSQKDPYALDIQIREDNQLMYYHGTTRVLVLKFALENGKVKITPRVDPAYNNFPECKDQYRQLETALQSVNQAAIQKAFRNYLNSAITVTKIRKHYDNKKEGYWQNSLCIRYGRLWDQDSPWLIFDRECVLGFDDTKEKDFYYHKFKEKYLTIKMKLQQNDPKCWGKTETKSFGDELDMLAIGKEGQIFVIELKHGTYVKGIYWGPLQVATYRDAFLSAVSNKVVIAGMENLIEQKMRLGLIPLQAKGILSNISYNRIEPVLAVAEPNNRSRCWEKLKLVLKEMEQCQSGFGIVPLKHCKIGPTVNHIKVSINIP